MLSTSFTVEKAAAGDIAGISALYDEVNDFLASTINYNSPRWVKGVYPAAETAEKAFCGGTLFVLKKDNKIAGSCIINNEQHPDYKRVKWSLSAEPEEVLSVHTLVTSPSFRKQGIAKKLLEFAVDYSRKNGAKTIRLDTYKANIPAINLYKKCGFKEAAEITTTVTKVRIVVFEYVL
ncbi:MAG: Acetyltransferase [Clostridia bacterium]|nr:Acetyltransferase [Clostridia bacterium]